MTAVLLLVVGMNDGRIAVIMMLLHGYSSTFSVVM